MLKRAPSMASSLNFLLAFKSRTITSAAKGLVTLTSILKTGVAFSAMMLLISRILTTPMALQVSVGLSTPNGLNTSLRFQPGTIALMCVRRVSLRTRALCLFHLVAKRLRLLMSKAREAGSTGRPSALPKSPCLLDAKSCASLSREMTLT